MAGSVNYVNPKVDQTVRIFDRFYLYNVDVPSLEYDAVYSYFRSIYGTAEAAGNFTVSLFRVAQQSSIPVMTLLEQIQGLNQLEGPAFDARAVKLESYISAMGVSPARLYALNNKNQEQISMLYKALIQRE